MSWVVVGTAAVSAVAADQKRQAQERANVQQSKISAAQTEYSPWTGITPQAYQPQAVDSSALGGAIQGGLSGAMFSQGLKKNDAEIAKLKAEEDAAKRLNPAP